ncbi:MAG: alpha/beta fold hydrolase [Deltaproteobacteria bacterium]|nr:alpha/beta fold hydrolase [Deltaproteobacteria bacterium]
MGVNLATSIEYEFVAQPAGLQPEFAAPPDANLQFLSTKAIDGFRVDAALAQPASKLADNSTLVVSVHGSGQSYDTHPNACLLRLLPSKSIAVLAINTRQAGARVNTENFFDVRRDLEAAIYTARALGYQKIVLHGHSLGNIHVQYYAANNWDVDIKAVILTGMFANLPWKSRHLLVQSEEDFQRLREAARQSLREGKQAELLPIGMRRTGTESEPVSGQHFLTYRAEQSSTADGTYWIRRIPFPILMIRDDGDLFIQHFEPHMLLAAAKAPGSLVPSIKYIPLPNHKGPNAGGHSFRDNQQPLADAVADWLREHGL